MSTRAPLQSLLILAMVSAVAGNPVLHVDQFPNSLNHITGANVTLFCSFPLSQDKASVRVHWWREGEHKFLEAKSDSRHQFEIRNKFSAVFRLLNVAISDSGLYYCRVSNAGKVGNGTGTRLLVTAPPDPPQIVPTLFAKESSTFLRLACTAGGFHSKELSIKWFVNGTEIVTGVRSEIQPRSGGLFEISSYLEEVHPAQNGTVYTCRVADLDNRTLQTLYTYTPSAEESESDVLPWWIYICIGCGAFLLLLLIITPILCKFCVCRGKGRKAVERSVREKQRMQRPADYRMASTAADFSSLVKETKPQHVDKRPARPQLPARNQQRDGKVIYATTQFKPHQGRKMGSHAPEPKNKSVTSKKYVLQS